MLAGGSAAHRRSTSSASSALVVALLIASSVTSELVNVSTHEPQTAKLVLGPEPRVVSPKSLHGDEEGKTSSTVALLSNITSASAGSGNLTHENAAEDIRENATAKVEITKQIDNDTTVAQVNNSDTTSESPVVISPETENNPTTIEPVETTNKTEAEAETVNTPVTEANANSDTTTIMDEQTTEIFSSTTSTTSTTEESTTVPSSTKPANISPTSPTSTESTSTEVSTEDTVTVDHPHNLETSDAPPKEMSSGIIALVMAIVFAVVVILVYVGLLLWRRYLEYRYGNRELLVNDLEFDTNDLRHFEL